MNTIKNKSVVITGATNGIGKAITKELTKCGYYLIILARNEEKIKGLHKELLSINPQVELDSYQVDLSLVKETNEALIKIKEKYDKIDVLVHSAGLIPNKIEKTSEGVEQSFAVSYLTRFLITENLLPLVLKSGTKLIFSVASPGHNGTIHFEDVHFDHRKFMPVEVVKQFNKCNDVYTSYLSQKFSSEALNVYCYDPGLVDTSIHLGWPFPFSLLMRGIAKPFFMKTPAKAAEIPAKIITGGFKPDGIFVNSKGKLIKCPEITGNREYQERVIDLGNEIIEST
ncbi:SDR family NAD(P)-dependent oxidoreductase [Ulvibacterium sp.]|uniref:SDR family NAD(P)-dependent oxidoreductase n=1 Tax=Ulvibacterium sp. TaxID=2665914 RepID=UPI002612EC43|nr:SDR family NAD(P)-dependent oxidoreductase [Ulvibacterium sp.]